ncbi:MAG: serpin family protein [Bacteroidales bacterium]
MRKYILFSTVLFVFFAACKTQTDNTTQTSNNIQQMPRSLQNNMYAFDVFKALHQQNSENMIISPFSISTALAMTYGGARGETADQMQKTLYFNENNESFHKGFSAWKEQIMALGHKNDQLQSANSLWAQEDFHFVEDFFQLIEQYYQSSLYKVDYKNGDREHIRKEINAWVSERTNNLIDELIKPGVLVEDTRLVLINAIYFLSQWKIAFDSSSTREDTFLVENGNSVKVPFMYMKDVLNYFENEKMQVLEMEYEGSDFSMVAVLPSENSSIGQLLEETQGEDFWQMLEEMELQETEVLFPSFKTRSRFDLEDVLSAMGMPLAFTNKADFSGMTQENDLKIDKVIHEAYIDVNEEGTEAAASTAVVMIRKTSTIDQEPVKVFRADRPFIYFIKENKSNTILFLGKVTDPSVVDE